MGVMETPAGSSRVTPINDGKSILNKVQARRTKAAGVAESTGVGVKRWGFQPQLYQK